MNLSQWKQMATESCEYRRHRMGKWQVLSAGHLYRNECQDCGKTVDINLKPMPNEIELGGEAVALTCNR